MANQLPALLVVDDDPLLLRALAISFSRRFTVLTAPGVEEAVLTLRASCVHAVVTDFHLPDGSGVEVLREASLTWPDALRVLMSASEEALNAPESQVFATVRLVKPFDVVDVSRLIAALVTAASADA